MGNYEAYVHTFVCSEGSLNATQNSYLAEELRDINGHRLTILRVLSSGKQMCQPINYISFCQMFYFVIVYQFY